MQSIKEKTIKNISKSTNSKHINKWSKRKTDFFTIQSNNENKLDLNMGKFVQGKKYMSLFFQQKKLREGQTKQCGFNLKNKQFQAIQVFPIETLDRFTLYGFQICHHKLNIIYIKKCLCVNQDEWNSLPLTSTKTICCRKTKCQDFKGQLQIIGDDQLSLRGGGCGQGKPEKYKIQQQGEQSKTLKFPNSFISDLVKYLNIIINKAQLASDQKQKEEILMAIQWFIVMKEHFNSLCFDSKSSSSVFDLIFQSIPQLLKSALIYLRISGFLCIQILQIINDLCRVLFSYFMTNTKRFLNIQDKNQLEELISNLEIQLEIEQSNIWIEGAEFEITMIKAVIQSSPSNSEEGKELLISFLGGLVKSVLIMSPTEELTDSLIGGAKFLYNAYKIQDLKKKYEIYYYFESLKWQIIQLLRKNVSIKKVLQILQIGYQNYIQNTNDWLLKCCWIRTIASLISYRPIIFKQNISQNIVEQSLKWNQLMKHKFINQLSFNQSMGRLSFSNYMENSETRTLNVLVKSLELQNFQLFNDYLLKNLEYSPVSLFSLKSGSKREQIQIDLLFEILTENNPIKEPVQFLIKLQATTQELFIKIKQGYEKSKTQKNDKQQKNVQQEELLTFIQQINKNTFKALSLSVNVYKAFLLYCERQKLILNSIVIENQEQGEIQKLKQTLLEELCKIESNYVEKCNCAFQQLYQERKNVIYSLAWLEDYFQHHNSQENQLKIDSQFYKMNAYFDLVSLLNKEFIDMNQKIEEFKRNNSKYQKKSIKAFSKEGTIKQLIQIASKNINIIQFKQQITTIYELLQVLTDKEGNISSRLINYNSLKYFLIDFVQQINETKEQIESVIQFIVKNINNLQHSESSRIQIFDNDGNISKIVNAKLVNQLRQIKLLFSQRQNLENIDEINDKYAITFDQIFQLFKNDSELLRQLQEKQSQKPALYTIALVQQLLVKYQSNPQKYQPIKEEIEKIYSQMNLNLDQQDIIFSEKQEGQHLNIEYLKKQLNQLIDSISFINEKFEIILDGIMDKIALYENLQLIELELEYQHSENVSLEYELADNKKLIAHLSCITDVSIELIDTNSNIKEEQINGLLDILLLFCDKIRPNYSNLANDDQNILVTAQSFMHNLVTNVKDMVDDEAYKVRQCYLINLMFVQSSCQEQFIIKFCQDGILQLWVSEKDERVKSLMNNEELLEMQKTLFSCNLRSFSKRLQQEMEEKLNKINGLEKNIYLEGDSQVRQSLKEQLEAEQQSFEDYLDNVNDMASKLDIGIQFLKDIKKSLAQLKQKIDKLQNTVNDIGDDVRKLRGKTFSELLNIRKRKVLEQMQLSSLNQIYIPLKCQEWDPISGKSIGGQSILLHEDFFNQEGEINEFLQKDLLDRDVLLLRGVAGSGKSRAAEKIEQFIWQKKDSRESDWIPIYVSLPTIKEPKFNLIDQALESDFYQFDKIQVKEFKQAIEQQNYKIVLILDSYDEMKQDCIQSNLYQTNRFQKDLFSLKDSNQIKQCFKVIITTRSEILTSSSYQTWFYGDAIESLKEVELLGFDDEQQSRYLEQFTMLCLKKEFLDLYYFMRQITNEKIVLDEFCAFWNKIQNIRPKISNNTDHDQNYMINYQQANQINTIVKAEKIFQQINKDQLINLEKKITELWSTKKFQKLIVNAQIQHILNTPFMMEIVVQVLPSLTKKYSNLSQFKDEFMQNFITIKLEDQLEKQLISQYQVSHQENSKQYTEADFKLQAGKIWDQLQNDKQLQKFSFVDKIMKNDLKIEDASIVARALMLKKLTVFDFYMTFIEFYHFQQMKKQTELGRIINLDSLMIDLFNFSQSLAIHLTINDLTQIRYVQKGQLALKYVETSINEEEDWLDAYFNDFKDNGDYKKLIRSCILISSKGRNISFTHKSIQEFFVGHFLLKILDEIQIINENEFQDQLQMCQSDEKIVSDIEAGQKQSFTSQGFKKSCNYINKSLLNQNQFNLSNDNYKGVMYLIKEEIIRKKSWKPKLLQIVKLSQISQQFTRAASNCLYLLGRNNEFLGFQQFQKLRISDIDLIGVSFYGTNLENSQFKNVSIRSCNFNKVNLRNSNWIDIQCDEQHSIVGHTGRIDIILFSNDGQILVSGSGEDKTLRFWQIKEGKQISLHQYSDLRNQNDFGQSKESFNILKAAFSLDDQKLALGWGWADGFDTVCVQNYAIQILNVKTLKSICFLLLPDQFAKEFSFTLDWRYLACCTESKSIYLVDVMENKQTILNGHDDKVNSLAFAENKKILISGSGDKTIKIWDYQKQILITELQGHQSSIEKVVVNGSILASCSDKTIKIWSIETFEELFKLDGHTSLILYLKFLSDCQSLVSWGHDEMILVWNIKEGKQLRCIKRTNKYNYGYICFSSDDKLLAQQNDSKMEICDIKVGKIISIIGNSLKSIYSMSFQPTSNIMATVQYSQNVIQLWNTNISKQSSFLDGHKSQVQHVGFSPDGLKIYSKDQDNFIKLWSVDDGMLLKSLKNQCACESIQFSHNGESLIIKGQLITVWFFKEDKIVTINANPIQTNLYFADINDRPQGDILACSFHEQISNKIRFYNIQEQKWIDLLEVNQKINSIQFSSNGLFLAAQESNQLNSYSYGKPNNVYLWNLEMNSSRITFENASDKQFSPNGLIIGVKSYIKKYETDGYKLFDLKGNLLAFIKHEGKMTFSPDSQILASIMKKNQITLWSTENGQEIGNLSGQQKFIEKFQFSPNSQYIASIGDDHLIYVYNIAERKLVKQLDGHKSQIKEILFSKNGSILASFGEEFSITLWNFQESVILNVLQEGYEGKIYMTQFSPNDKFMVSLDYKYNVVVSDLDNWKTIYILKDCSFSAQYPGIFIFTHDSRKLAFSRRESIQILNLYEKTDPILLKGHNKCVVKLVFSLDNKVLYSIGEWESFLLSWDVEKGKLISLIEGNHPDQRQIILSNDDRKIAIYLGDMQISLYDTETGQQLSIFKEHRHLIKQIAFSPDCKYLASCSLDFSIILRDLCTSKYTILDGHQHFVNRIIFSSDSTQLISASSDSTIRLWDILNMKQISQITSTHPYELTFSPDQKYLAFLENDQLKIWNLSLELIDFQGGKSQNKILHFRKFIITFGYSGIQVWDVAQRKLQHIIEIKSDIMQSMNDGKYLFYVSEKNTIKQWDVINNKQITIFYEHTNQINNLALSPNQKVMVTCSDDCTLKLVYVQEASNEKILSSYKTLALYNPITAYDCQLQGATIHSKNGWNLKQLFLQRGGNDDQGN